MFRGRGWCVTRPLQLAFLSSGDARNEPKSRAIVAGGWRVTGRTSRPRVSGFLAMDSSASHPRVARDSPARAASSGDPRAVARAPRRDTAPAPGFVVAAPASCALLVGMQPRRRAGAPPMLRAQTNACTPCIACWLLVACRAASALDARSPRETSGIGRLDLKYIFAAVHSLTQQRQLVRRRSSHASVYVRPR